MAAVEAQELEPLLRAEDVDATPVYPIIHMIRADVTHFIDTPLTYDALMAPDLTYTLIRPLQEKYTALQRKGNLSIVFCFLINRVHFYRDQNFSTRSLSLSRATLCEILAIHSLREHGDNILELAMAITTSWPVYNGADESLLAEARDERDDDLEDRVGNAIEMAILSKAKKFIKSSACQKVIDSIWSGRCVYQAESSHSILSDTYKRTPIHFYDPHKAPLLDHYRLKVPAIRSVLEYTNFLFMFILFVIALELSEMDRLNASEILFMVYALGFSLEKIAAMQEHGIRVYFTGTWNPFDLAFVTIYCSYAFLRLYGIHYDRYWARNGGMDCLALAACLIFPRLAFVTLKNNLMVLSLRAMLVQFIILMLIAAFCFGGFLYALWTLSRNAAGYSAGQIAWWMLDLWFGLDATGFDKATQFHFIFGPLLMVTYACLSNTLLLTVLVSILSHTFSTISEDAAAEAMFRRAVSTVEGVKADSLFSYQPPINLIALVVMLPASYILSPRWFHKVNVFMIRLTSFPVLLFIAWYERQSMQSGTTSFYDTVGAAAEAVFDTLPRGVRRLTFFEGLVGSGGDIDAVFEIEDERNNLHDTQDMREAASRDIQSKQAYGALKPNASHPIGIGPPSPSPSDSANTPHSPQSHLRQRVNSLMNRGTEAAQSFTSPLAQIFQPLIVADDDTLEEPGDLAPTSAVSYGPATRRRLSSMHRPSASVGDPRGNQAHPLKKISSVDSNSFRGDWTSQQVSESPDQGGRDPSQNHEPETVDELSNDQYSAGGDRQLTKRLDSIERRQKKIEDLLIQLSNDIRSR